MDERKGRMEVVGEAGGENDLIDTLFYCLIVSSQISHLTI